MWGGGGNSLLIGEIKSVDFTNITSKSITFNGNTIFIAFYYANVGDRYSYLSSNNYYIYDTKNELLLHSDADGVGLQSLSLHSQIDCRVLHTNANDNTSIEYINIGTMLNKTFNATLYDGMYVHMYYMILN